MSPVKARGIADAIRGQSVGDALRITGFHASKAAAQIGKTLKSAVANAAGNEGVPAERLIVKEAFVDGGPVLKRFRPRARGSASAIRKRTTHITVVLTDGK